MGAVIVDLGQIWLLRMLLALYAMAMYPIYVLLGGPESSSTVALAYMFTAVYADHDLGHYGSTTRHYAAPLYVMPMALYV